METLHFLSATGANMRRIWQVKIRKPYSNNSEKILSSQIAAEVESLCYRRAHGEPVRCPSGTRTEEANFRSKG